MKYTIAIAAIALLVACGETNTTGVQPAEAQAPPVDAQMEVTDNAEAPEEAETSTDSTAIVKTVYDGFAAGDIALATSEFADDVVWNEAENSPYSDQNPYEGTNEIVTGLFARLGAEWDYFKATPDEFLPSGDKVITIGRYTAKNKATGKEMDIPFVHVWTLEDGKIKSFQQYTDTLAHAEVMED
ncbi:nuclear transport factor 2 family protein [Henriciella litoralis]|uniref:nuclear transport factor 2 family protein n=1 Tax=Henriciella litoralis TaxID=568102 RepID=UPI000A02309D|nr:nuclear transport factor 2 family protein [Henriciella litoralis]